jgi:hypothetical protein
MQQSSGHESLSGTFSKKWQIFVAKSVMETPQPAEMMN